MAASEAAKEALSLARFLGELGFPPDEPTELGLDNQAAIAISYNPEHHTRCKHVDRRHFFVRECVENKQLRVPYVNTLDNLADFFTKPLPAKQFFAMRDKIMNVPAAASRPEDDAAAPASAALAAAPSALSSTTSSVRHKPLPKQLRFATTVATYAPTVDSVAVPVPLDGSRKPKTRTHRATP